MHAPARRAAPAQLWLISILLLVDAVLHLALEWVFFHGNFSLITRVPYVSAYLLFFFGALVLVAALWSGLPWLRQRIWVAEGATLVFVVASIVAYLLSPRPNPYDLALISKTIEGVLVVALVARLIRRRGHAAIPAASPLAEPPLQL